MKFIAVSAGVLLASASVHASAEEATMSEPVQAASLHEGPLDMVAYFLDLEDGGYELTATFRARTDDALPMRVVMKLMNGDNVAFGMPGYADSLYRFARANDVVTASVEPIARQVAAAN